jgi:hypothetical protein
MRSIDAAFTEEPDKRETPLARYNRMQIQYAHILYQAYGHKDVKDFKTFFDNYILSNTAREYDKIIRPICFGDKPHDKPC